MTDKPFAILYDVDGTLADVSGLRHYVTGADRNFDKFHRESVNAPPIQWVVDHARQTYDIGWKVLIVTARSDKYKNSTGFWLAMYEIPHHDLFMRRQGDSRPDYEVKKDILRTIRQAYTPLMAVDDNPNVIRLWQEEGLSTIIVPGWEE